MLLSKCAVCNSKKSKFPKEQEARGLLSFGIRTTSSQIPLLGKRYKTNEILNKFLLAGDKFMPEIDLKQPGFTCSLCGPFTKNKERIKKIKKKNKKTPGDWRYIYQNELDKACFQYDMDYGDFKDLNRRTAADKVLCDKAFNIAKNPKNDGY